MKKGTLLLNSQRKDETEKIITQLDNAMEHAFKPGLAKLFPGNEDQIFKSQPFKKWIKILF